MSAGTDADARAAQRSRDIVRPEKPFNRFKWTVTTVLLLGFLGTSLTVDIEPSLLLDLPERTWFYLVLIFGPPELAEIPRATTAMIESLGMAWIGTIIGAVVSLPLGFLAAQNLASRPTAFAARQVLNVFRAVPEIIFLILFLPVLGLGPATVALALGVSSIGTIGKLTAEVIEGIDPGPVEAAAAVGGGAVQRIRWSVLPQVMPEVVALWLYRFEINIRNSVVAGAVGAGGIGTLVIGHLQVGRNWSQAGMALIVMVLITLAVDTVSGRVRRRIIRGPQRPVDLGSAEPAPEGPDAPSGDSRAFAPI